MTKLSVNVNKIATLRNARGENYPNLLNTAIDILNFGADGITIHPRPDERHIKYQDAYDLKSNIKSELNIEGNPIQKFIELVLDVIPDQVTLVPDSDDAITSNSGWNTIDNFSFLSEIVNEFKRNSIRVSIFIDPEIKMLENAKKLGADRVELFTGPYGFAIAILLDPVAWLVDALESYSSRTQKAEPGHVFGYQPQVQPCDESYSSRTRVVLESYSSRTRVVLES